MKIQALIESAEHVGVVELDNGEATHILKTDDWLIAGTPTNTMLLPDGFRSLADNAHLSLDENLQEFVADLNAGDYPSGDFVTVDQYNEMLHRLTFHSFIERDECQISIQDSSGKTVFRISSPEEMQDFIDDGFVTGAHDLPGFLDYLQTWGAAHKNATLVEAD